MSTVSLKVLLAHPGTQHAHQLAIQLESHSLLFQFWTCFAISKGSFTHKLLSYLPRQIIVKLNRRIISIPKNKVRTLPFLELRMLAGIKNGGRKEDLIFKRNEAFQKAIPDSVILASDVVIGFDTSSWILATRCKQLKKKFILDVSIAHPLSKEQIFSTILRQFPNWSFAIARKPEWMIALEKDEMTVSHHIVVASTFTKKTLCDNNIDSLKVSINPYGVDTNFFLPSAREGLIKKPIRLVFVGLVDPRKGIPLLLDVCRKFNAEEIELTLVGPVSPEVKNEIHNSDSRVTVLGQVPFGELSQILKDHHVLIFPSYFEGFGQVVIEALACGLPVITTDSTCGTDVVSDNVDGRVIPTGSAAALEDAIRFFIDNIESYNIMSKAARMKALSYSWDSYGARWKQIIIKVNG